MACGFTVVGPVHFMFVRRISAFESSQASLGYNSSGQANSVHNPHEQHIAAHWFQYSAPVAVNARLRITWCGSTA